jgi:hypothetical protein
MSSNSSILTAFNDHFVEFVNDIVDLFPGDTDLLAAKNSFALMRKANPRLLIKIWNMYIVIPYKKEIESGDIRFFLNKDYGNDLKYISNSDKIIESINRLRHPIQMMAEDNQAKTMKYIQNLTKLSAMYVE